MFKKLCSFFKSCCACSLDQTVETVQPVLEKAPAPNVEKPKPVVKKTEGKKKTTAKQKIAKSKAAKRTPTNKK
ncbi:MAG: hypothetical protein AAB323_01115 [Pseudomonadota bacterium]